SNAPALAGCFGLPDSVAVWKLINEDKDMKDVINAYITHRVNNYGYAEDYGKRPDANVFPALMAPTTLRVGVLEVKDKSLPELTVLWYVVQLMRAKPSLFPRTNITTDPIRLSPYDVLHGWKLLSFFWKQIQGGKKAKGKPQKNVAIPPVFHTPTNPNA
ncbi:hypothetical protein KXV35_008809, partial [Aspergillus fumigatus]